MLTFLIDAGLPFQIWYGFQLTFQFQRVSSTTLPPTRFHLIDYEDYDTTPVSSSCSFSDQFFDLSHQFEAGQIKQDSPPPTLANRWKMTIITISFSIFAKLYVSCKIKEVIFVDPKGSDPCKIVQCGHIEANVLINSFNLTTYLLQQMCIEKPFPRKIFRQGHYWCMVSYYQYLDTLF